MVIFVCANNVNNNNWWLGKHFLLLRLDGDHLRTIGATQVKFCTAIDYRRIYTYTSHLTNNYKHKDSPNLLGSTRKI
jgi:hypothetical protein